jgi:hypothetical protein
MSYEPDEEYLKFYLRVVCSGLVEKRGIEDPKERGQALDEMLERALFTPTAYSMRNFYRENGRYPDYREDGKYPVLTSDGLEGQILDVRIREVLWLGGRSPEILDPEGAKPVLEELMELSRGTPSEELWKRLYAQLDHWKHLPKDKFIPSDEEMKAKIRELATMRIGDLKIDQPKVRERIIDEMVEQLKKPPFRLEKSLRRYYASHGEFPDFVKF